MLIPLDLRHALESGDCALFIGAGVGDDLLRPNGTCAPTGAQLASELAAHFGVDPAGSTDLGKISEVIELRNHGRKELIAFLQERLADLTPDQEFQSLLARPFKAIFTTNYGFGIERAYEINSNPPQTPVTATVTADLGPINPMFEVPVIHLHGMLFGEREPQVIITETDYANFRERRRMLFELLKKEFATSTILYVGYSHNDSNWKILLAEFVADSPPANRPLSYRVAPATPPLDLEILRSKGIETIETDLKGFVQAVTLEVRAPLLAPDHLKDVKSAVPDELRDAFDKNPAPVARLLSSWTYVNAAPLSMPSNAKQFLHGDRANWGLLARREYFERDLEEELYDELLDYATSTTRKASPLAILGPAGYGMTTLLYALAVRLVGERAGPVFMHVPGTPVLEGDVVFAASLFPDKRTFLFVDDAADFSSSLLDSGYRLRDAGKTALLVLAERLNEWRLRRGELNAREFAIELLSDPEIERLLDCLQKNNELGILEDLSHDLQIAAIKKKYDKQLLVALREATENKSFDAILEDEYINLGDDFAKTVYLTVCCFYQHGALIRDGLLSELIGVPIANIYKLTAESLEGVVVYDTIDPMRGTYAARARHRTVAAVVWERCGDLARREELLQKALATLNLNYKQDADAFEQFIRSDHLVDSIRTLDQRTNFFETAVRKDPTSPYVRQHYARTLSRSERPELALLQIEKAIDIDPNVRVLYHTQGMVLSELALTSESRDLGRKRLAQAEQSFRRSMNMYARDDYSYSSLARLFLGWAKKYSDEAVDYLTKCEAVISEGLRVVTAKESLWVVSAELQDWIGNEPAKIQALERAVKDSPNAIVPRYLLARAYRKDGKPERATHVLDPILKDNPTEFRLCIEYARSLEESGQPLAKAIAVLSLGTLYGLSDARFISIYAGMMFMNEQFSDAIRIFSETSTKDFSPLEANTVFYRPIAPDPPRRHMQFTGNVVSLSAGFAFIEASGYPRFMCPSSKQHGVTLRRGMVVTFEPCFRAKGQVADKPKDTFTGPPHKRPV
jgi:tetratricopeptide (TPR) repeat protein